MKSALRALLISLAVVWPLGAAAKPDEYRFVTQDGKYGLVILEEYGQALFASPDFQGDYDDRGGDFRDCSNSGFRCAELLGLTLSVPKARSFPPSWKANNVEFVVTQKYGPPEARSYLISASSQYYKIYFMYSDSKGIQYFTYSIPFGPPGPQVAFVAVGERRLLAP